MAKNLATTEAQAAAPNPHDERREAVFRAKPADAPELMAEWMFAHGYTSEEAAAAFGKFKADGAWRAPDGSVEFTKAKA